MNKIWIVVVGVMLTVALVPIAFVAATGPFDRGTGPAVAQSNPVTPAEPAATEATPLTPEDIGAYFLDDYHSVRAADFEPSISRSQAVAAAVDDFMDGYNLPRGRGVETGVDVKATTGLFSGAPGGFGERTIKDRQVWVVVIHDLPFSISCGPPGMGDTCPFPRPRLSLAVDAATGEVISGELSGGGPRSPKWDAIDLRPESQPPLPAPTPVPDKDTYCKENPHNPNPIDPPPGGPTPTPVPEKVNRC